MKEAKARCKSEGGDKNRKTYDTKKKQLDRLKEQLHKLEVARTDRDENKTIALGTSKLNYLDPRISVAWCKKFDVPIEKVYNKTQRDKFAWACGYQRACSTRRITITLQDGVAELLLKSSPASQATKDESYGIVLL